MHGQVLTHVGDGFTMRIQELNQNVAACLWSAASLLLVHHLLIERLFYSGWKVLKRVLFGFRIENLDDAL